MAGRDGFDVVAFGGEVVSGIADGSSVIRIPVGKRGVVAHLGTVDEEEGVILAKGIVHGSLASSPWLPLSHRFDHHFQSIPSVLI